VIETYKMFAYDEGWSRRINEAIDSGLTAEAAIERVQQRTRMRMRQIDDPLLQDRMHDLEDLSNRLLRIVSGQLGTAAQLGPAAGCRSSSRAISARRSCSNMTGGA
jgi:phosphotransferase system enzyme I (PtsP)